MPAGFVRPACGEQREPWRAKRGRLVCSACRHQYTVTAGTIFDKTRTPLTTWFDAAWHMGTHQGAFSPEHLQSYLEEFTFRFNRRTSSSRGQLFRRLLEQAVATSPVTQADTLHGYQWESEKQGG